ncbi:MAG TPA: aspartate aminotransferase family protein, partial [Solirubrobacteraceae bacterium]
PPPPPPPWHPATTIRSLSGGGPRSVAQLGNPVLEHAEGVQLYGTRGERLLDAVAGYGVTSIGHSHPHWVQAVVAQAARLVNTPLDTSELAAYLKALAAVLPTGMDGISLASTGAEAVEIALQLAQTARGRPGILTFTESFHGRTSGVRYTRDPSAAEARLLGPHWLRSAPFPACQEHDAVSYSACREPVDKTIATLAARGDLDDVAAVLVEPVLGTAGNIPPRGGFLAALSELCRTRGWLLAFDESITGFGRTGELFAWELFEVQPDILILGKGLGGGFPLSAVCAAKALWDASPLSGPSGTSSSYGGNPLACVAGRATLEIVTGDGFLDQVRACAERAAERLRELADGSPRVARPRGVGLMLGFDLVSPDTGELASRSECEAVFRACRDSGALVAATTPMVRLNPPLTITLAETDRLFDILREALR